MLKLNILYNICTKFVQYQSTRASFKSSQNIKLVAAELSMEKQTLSNTTTELVNEMIRDHTVQVNAILTDVNDELKVKEAAEINADKKFVYQTIRSNNTEVQERLMHVVSMMYKHLQKEVTVSAPDYFSESSQSTQE